MLNVFALTSFSVSVSCLVPDKICEFCSFFYTLNEYTCSLLISEIKYPVIIFCMKS